MPQHDEPISASDRPLDTPDPFSRLLLELETMQSVLQKVADLAKTTLSAVDEASVTLMQGSRPVSAVYTGLLAYELDEAQYEHDLGPCLDAAKTRRTVLVEDARAEPRYPQFAERAVRGGALSSMSIPLVLQQDMPAGLNLYSLHAHSFDADGRNRAERYATTASVAIRNMLSYDSSRKTAEQLRQAMESRAVIDQAKGIIMAERRCTADEAFQILAQASQRANRKLRDIALDIVQGVGR